MGPLWVNAQTCPPIRLVTGAASSDMTVRSSVTCPPTAASLALLQVPVPPSPRLPGALAHPKQRLTGPMFHRSGYKRPYVPSGRSNSGVQSSSSTVRMIRRSREASWFFSRSDRRPRRWQFREYAYHL